MSIDTCTWLIDQDGEWHVECDPATDVNDPKTAYDPSYDGWVYCPFCGARIETACEYVSNGDLYGADPWPHGPYCGEVVVV